MPETFSRIYFSKLTTWKTQIISTTILKNQNYEKKNWIDNIVNKHKKYVESSMNITKLMYRCKTYIVIMIKALSKSTFKSW